MYHTRLFQVADDNRICLNNYCFTPRVVAYEDVQDDYDWRNNHSFWTYLRVQDISMDVPGNPNRDGYALVRDSLADVYRRSIMNLFHMDSLVLHLIPESRRIIVPPDTTRFTPAGIDFLTYNFGRVAIPMGITEIQAVFHYTSTDPNGKSSVGDSLVFQMGRIESHRKDIRRRSTTRLVGD